jgi:hypothetical protein
MLKNPSDGLLECLRHAEDCAREATAQPDGSRSRLDFLELERRWLILARSIEFANPLSATQT